MCLFLMNLHAVSHSPTTMQTAPLELPISAAAVAAAASTSTPLGPPLLAVHSRILASANISGSSIELYDTQDVVPTAALPTVPTGSAARYLSSLLVTDLADRVHLSAIVFTPDGLLAVAGVCYEAGSGGATRRTVLHVYSLILTSSGGSGTVLASREGVAQCARLSMAVLPHLQFRASLPDVAGMRALVPHPRCDGLLGLVLSGDATLRFYGVAATATASPFQSAYAAASAAASSSTYCGAVACGAPILHASFSADGRALAVATASASGRHAVAVYSVDAAKPLPSSLTTRQACVIRCEVAVTALAWLPVPAAGGGYSRFTRFSLSRHAVVTGHANGFVNVWWCGNTGAAQSDGVVAMLSSPTASYPPFSALRGPVTCITPGVVVDALAMIPPQQHAGAQSLLLSSSGSSSRAGGGSSASWFSGSDHKGAASVVFIGAAGSRGWRPLVFPHAGATTATTSTAASSPTRPGVAAVPDAVHPLFGYDSHGRRVELPHPLEDVSRFIIPAFRCPSLAECARAAVIGDASVTTASTTSTGGNSSASSSVMMFPPVFAPAGAAVATRHPCAMDAWVDAAEEGSGEESAQHIEGGGGGGGVVGGTRRVVTSKAATFVQRGKVMTGSTNTRPLRPSTTTTPPSLTTTPPHPTTTTTPLRRPTSLKRSGHAHYLRSAGCTGEGGGNS